MTDIAKLGNKQALWLERIAAWEESNLSQFVFCEQNNLTISAFGYWRTRLKKLKTLNDSSNGISFLPVNIKQDKYSRLTLQINHQHSIELSHDFDAALLTKIIQAVQDIL